MRQFGYLKNLRKGVDLTIAAVKLVCNRNIAIVNPNDNPMSNGKMNFLLGYRIFMSTLFDLKRNKEQ